MIVCNCVRESRLPPDPSSKKKPDLERGRAFLFWDRPSTAYAHGEGNKVAVGKPIRVVTLSKVRAIRHACAKDLRAKVSQQPVARLRHYTVYSYSINGGTRRDSPAAFCLARRGIRPA